MESAADVGGLRLREKKPADQREGKAHKGKAKRRRSGAVGPCSLIVFVVLTLLMALYGGKGWRVLRGYVTRDYVPGWVNQSEEVAERGKQLLADPAVVNGQCQLPMYPDGAVGVANREDFRKRFWVHSRMSAVMVELGSIQWGIRDAVSSKETLKGWVLRTGEWTLHYDHSNKTVMEHEIHLEKVFEPKDPYNAPWAEVAVEPSPDLPDHFFPLEVSVPWKLLIIPALSGHPPTITQETAYFTVLTGALHIIVYRNSHAFHVSTIHVHDWHNDHLPSTRGSGNHGRTCILRTDQSVLIPSGYGYAFIAVANSVVLRSPVVEGF